MEIQSSTLIMSFVNFFIILWIISFWVFIIIKVIRSIYQSKNTNEEILEELKTISSKLDKKD